MYISWKVNIPFCLYKEQNGNHKKNIIFISVIKKITYTDRVPIFLIICLNTEIKEKNNKDLNKIKVIWYNFT